MEDLRLEQVSVPFGATALLLLSSGEYFFGRGSGCQRVGVGELCFNTCMSGYQEVLTDPSYAGQVINFTFPHIGNVGCNDDDLESRCSFALGAVFRNFPTESSNFRSGEDFVNFLLRYDLPSISGIDSRYLTHYVRDAGVAPSVLISYDEGGRFDLPYLLSEVRGWSGLSGVDLAKLVSCKEAYEWSGEGLWHWEHGYGEGGDYRYHVVAVDYGIKHNILRNLSAIGCRVSVVPAWASAEQILSYEPDGIFLSNGPGDPSATGVYAVPILQELLECDIPIFGICLGHQLLAMALGAETEKMALGHRGANHPVREIDSGRVEITSQNHGFVVRRDSLPSVLRETHSSLFDGSLEGVELRGRPIFSVQYHPEASPGPGDSHYLFERFISNIENANKGE